MKGQRRRKLSPLQRRPPFVQFHSPNIDVDVMQSGTCAGRFFCYIRGPSVALLRLGIVRMGCCSSDEGALVEYGPKKEKIATKRPPKLAPAPAPPTRSLAPAPISTPAPGITYRNEANLEPGLGMQRSRIVLNM
eukprot:540524-Amorphochlora_amoeboformis.AAC.1